MPRYSWHDRLRNFDTIERLTAAARSRDHLLALAAKGRLAPARADGADGWPSGGDGGGRSSGVSNPTLGAVEARDRWQEQVQGWACEAIDLYFEISGLLAKAQELTAKALDGPRQPAVDPVRPDNSNWCVSCMRERRDVHGQPVRGTVIMFSQRTPIMKRSRRDLCSWCLKEWEASNDENARRRLPDVRLVMWRAEHPGQTVTERVRKLVLDNKVSA